LGISGGEQWLGRFAGPSARWARCVGGPSLPIRHRCRTERGTAAN
jgi:hypothetical protein